MKKSVILFIIFHFVTVTFAQEENASNTTYWLNKQAVKLFQDGLFNKAIEACNEALSLSPNQNQDYTHFLLGIVDSTDYSKLSFEETVQAKQIKRDHLLQSGFLINEPFNTLYKGFEVIEKEDLVPVLSYYPAIALDRWRDMNVALGNMNLYLGRYTENYTLFTNFISRWVSPTLRERHPVSIGELYFEFASVLDASFLEKKIAWLDSAEVYAKKTHNKVLYAYANLNYEKAQAYYDRWQYEKAYQEALKGLYLRTNKNTSLKYTSEDTTDYNANELLIKAAFYTKRYKEVVEYTELMLTYHEDNSGLFDPNKQVSIFLGLALERLNRFKEAEKVWAKIYQEDSASWSPNETSALGQLAWIRTVLGNYKQAKKDYTNYFQLDNEGNNSFSLEGRGRVYYLENNYESALADFEKAISIGSAQGYDKYSILWKYFTLLKIGKSKAVAQQSLKAHWNELSESTPLYIDYVIDAVLGVISEEEALAAIKTFEGKDSHANESVAYFYLGMWHDSENRTAKAKAYWQKAVQTQQYPLVPYQFAKKFLELH